MSGELRGGSGEPVEEGEVGDPGVVLEDGPAVVKFPESDL